MTSSCIGAAIALLDAVYLPLHISGVSFKMIGYGMPRVCAIFRNHPNPIDISMLFRLEIKRLQITLTPISLLRTSITSQHRVFFLRLSSDLIMRMLCRKDFVPIIPGLQQFLCGFLLCFH